MVLVLRSLLTDQSYDENEALAQLQAMLDEGKLTIRDMDTMLDIAATHFSSCDGPPSSSSNEPSSSFSSSQTHPVGNQVKGNIDTTISDECPPGDTSLADARLGLRAGLDPNEKCFPEEKMMIDLHVLD